MINHFLNSFRFDIIILPLFCFEVKKNPEKAEIFLRFIVLVYLSIKKFKKVEKIFQKGVDK